MRGLQQCGSQVTVEMTGTVAPTSHDGVRLAHASALTRPPALPRRTGISPYCAMPALQAGVALPFSILNTGRLQP